MMIHLYLVSGQATPNITPALDKNTRPEHVILLVSPDMKNRADWLTTVLKESTGVKVSCWPIQNPWDIQHIRDKVLDLLAEHEHDAIILNATGGTKPMSITAYEAFRAFDKSIFYVHPEHDQLIWMHPSDKDSHSLADRIRIPHFIQAHGREVVERGAVQVPPPYREFAQQLIDEIKYFADALGILNWYASSAERNKQLRSEEIEEKHLAFDPLLDLLDRLEGLDILKVVNNRLVFQNEAARFFTNGGWLEQYVFATVTSLKKELPTIQDTAQSLSVERRTEKIPNEPGGSIH